MSYQFRKAIRTNTSILLALAAPSGGGKTFSALRLARGLVGAQGRCALIDTEAGRALHYADRFDFDHLDLKPPFSPETYTGAIVAAEDQGYGVIIVDSMSHEWAGDGGCQDQHDDQHARLGGGENTNVLAWREPKLAHKRMVSRLLQCRAHLLFCLRAEEKSKFVKVDGKTRIEPAGWVPICEKSFMYEMTASFMLHDEHPGIGVPIKLQEQHKACFPAGELLSEAAVPPFSARMVRREILRRVALAFLKHAPSLHRDCSASRPASARLCSPASRRTHPLGLWSSASASRFRTVISRRWTCRPWRCWPATWRRRNRSANNLRHRAARMVPAAVRSRQGTRSMGRRRVPSVAR